jgi:glucuronosyltransferase
MKNISKRYHDQPLPPLQLAKFWVEYVLRNDGADHMKSSALSLSFTEYHCLDLIGFLLVVVLAVLALLMFIIYRICCCYSSKPIKQKYN